MLIDGTLLIGSRMADPGRFSLARLNNTNYATWKFEIEMLLTREELWFVVEEAKPEPVTAAWTKADKKARATIALSVEQSQYPLIKDGTTALAVWNALKSYHEKTTMTSQLSLLIRLCDGKLQEGGDAEKHLLEMDSLFGRLQSAGLELGEKLKVAMVLRSMPESYHFLASALEARPDADITMELVKSKLLDEFHKRCERDGTGVGGEQVLKVQKSSRTCFFCKQPGHFKKDCHKWLRTQEEAGPSGKSKSSSGNQRKVKAKQVTNTERDPVSFLVQEESYVSRATLKQEHSWTVDSGASCHMTSNGSFFDNLDESTSVHVMMANGNRTKSGGHGGGYVAGMNGAGKPVDIRLDNVLYVPDLDSGLLSVSKIADKGFGVLFTQKSVEIIDKSKRVVALGERSGGLYVLKDQECAAVSNLCHSVNCQHTWHRRFGHRDPAVLDRIQKGQLATGMKLVNCGMKIVCDCCLEGKMARLPFPKQAERKTTQPLQLIHTDLCGPMSTVTPGGNRYFMVLIDDYSRYLVLYLLKDKGEAKHCIKSFVRLVENQFGRKPQAIRSDRGAEFVNKELKQFYSDEGIRMELTAGYAPQQNGVAERRNRYLQEMAVCMLLDAGLGKQYWGEAIATASYIQNRLPSRSTEKTPMELWSGQKPDLSELKVFGCDAYVYIPDVKRKKLEKRAEKLTFIGYACGSKAYRFLNKQTGKIIISRDAKFLELGVEIQEEQGPSSVEPVKLQLFGDGDQEEDEDNEEDDGTEPDSESDSDDEEFSDEHSDKPEEEKSDEEEEDKSGEEEDEVRRSQRPNAGTLPTKLNDYVVGVAQLEECDPKNYEEAVRSVNKSEWMRAMDSEYEALLSKDTWKLVPLPKGRHAIGSKWVFKQKKNSSGQTVRFKARLVAQGYAQRYGEDFDEVHAPVALQQTFRVLLTVAGHKGLQVRHVDVKNAYLNGVLQEEIFMRQPPGYSTVGKEELVCKLNRSLYGLKQAARVWNSTIKEVLVDLGFRQSEADACLYSKQFPNGEWIYLLIYVDDMVLVCKDGSQITGVENALRKRFEISSLGEIKQFLGITVEKDINGMYMLSQKCMILEIADRFGLTDAKPSKYPVDPGYFRHNGGEKLPDNVLYHKLVGALLYVATNTRPDIAAAVSILSRKTNCPAQQDWLELKRVVRYLVGTQEYQLRLASDRSKNLELVGYSDADWAGDTTDRKSTSGFVFQIGDASVSWASRKQACVTTSTMEAEYVALSEAAQETTWLRRLLAELGYTQRQPTIINEDNRGCIDFVSLERQNKRSKHIDTKFYHAKDLCTREVIQLRYCPTDSMIADVFTKPLGATKIQLFAEKLGLCSNRKPNRNSNRK